MAIIPIQSVTLQTQVPGSGGVQQRGGDVVTTTVGATQAAASTDKVSLSPQGRQLSQTFGGQQSTSDAFSAATNGDASSAATNGDASSAATNGDASSATTNGDASSAATNGDASSATTNGDASSATTNGDAKLTEAQQEQLLKLKNRDQQVRNHEQAHLSAAGPYAAGGASFTYQRGPDGKSYAIGGEVPIDVSNADTPQATLQKMATIEKAALAPADPSGADHRIAAEAEAKATKARMEIAKEQQQKLQGDSTDTTGTGTRNTNGSSGSSSDNPQSSATDPRSNATFGGVSIGNIIATYQRIGTQV